jgi:predicted dehydrogenase
MTYTTLIVGMGIGNLYKEIYDEMGYNVVTVDTDPTKGATYTNLIEACEANVNLRTVHICTPNYTHEAVAQDIFATTNTVDVMFVEKPGLQTPQAWNKLVQSNRGTRIMMVKNNMWRNNMAALGEASASADKVTIHWINKNRIPSPGSWFTDRSKAFGGVSRDLMPHLLSFYMSMNPGWHNTTVTERFSAQRHVLNEVFTTDYGTVHPDGVYDVDDYARLVLDGKWELVADWASGTHDDIRIEFIYNNKPNTDFGFGLCPVHAYKHMIEHALSLIASDNFWTSQIAQDMFIHERISLL